MTQNRYKFIDADGKHLHTLDGRPLIGTSSVASVLAKPLTWWASGLAVKEFGCPDAKVLTKLRKGKASVAEIHELHERASTVQSEISAMSGEEYVALLDRAYRAHDQRLGTAAAEGTDLHKELELLVTAAMRGDVYAASERLQPFIAFIRNEVQDWLWCETHMYSEKWWTGGISDLGVRTKEGKVLVIDFKSAKADYLSAYWQAGGYSLQLKENGGFDRDGNQLFPPVPKIDGIGILAFGAKEPKVQVRYDVAECEQNFLHELALYRALAEERD